MPETRPHPCNITRSPTAAAKSQKSQYSCNMLYPGTVWGILHSARWTVCNDTPGRTQQGHYNSTAMHTTISHTAAAMDQGSWEAGDSPRDSHGDHKRLPSLYNSWILTISFTTKESFKSNLKSRDGGCLSSPKTKQGAGSVGVTWYC